MDYDIEKMRSMFGDGNEEDNEGGGLTDMVKDMMQSIFGDEVPEDLGSIMGSIQPGDLTNMMLDMENGLGGLFGSENGEDEEAYDEVDFEEILDTYKPECSDEKDVEFKDALKTWLKEALPAIDESGITMLGIELDEEMDFEEGINLAYNDENTVWDIKGWLDSCASTFDDEVFDNWYFDEQGFIAHMNEDGSENGDKVFEMIVLAVKELFDDGFIESCFGRKIPFVISNGMYDYRTAVWSATASGRELFDQSFFEACGLYEDDEEDTPEE